MKALTAWLAASQDYFQHLGPLGLVAFAGCMILAGLASLPLSPFGITAGIIFGFGPGFLAVQLGTTISAAVNFVVSRYLLRGFVQRKLAGHAKFRAIDAAVGREGWKIVALMRFVPMPFGLVNYLFGLTAVPLVPYILATAFPIVLSNLFFVWVGTTANAGIEAMNGVGRQRHPLEFVMMGVGVLAAFGAMAFVTRVARQAIAKTDESLAAK